jgi:hypothetical protein
VNFAGFVGFVGFVGFASLLSTQFEMADKNHNNAHLGFEHQQAGHTFFRMPTHAQVEDRINLAWQRLVWCGV